MYPAALFDESVKSAGKSMVAPPQSSARTQREITTGELLGQAREIVIIHNGERYLLRITANNKLILTK